MTTVQLIELGVGVLLLAVLAFFAFVWIRRHVIAGSAPLLLCALRTPAHPTWRLGLLRFGDRSIDWFPMIAATLRPAASWERSTVQMGAPTPHPEPIPGIGEACTVHGEVRGEAFDLAMTPSGLTAIRAWLESAPPGFPTAPGQPG